ncbi:MULTISPECIES: ABC transporter ATP-binding protein [unclassified Variovorax]|uniref:ABC transporter ATP-binding protein n=1 Tax=unclassified Variovorax TaxID=663243 RepID=UPI00076C90CD|nr:MULTISPECIES: ABC transporter ATP-binding protein [unclassified Variovorax]KWT96973.1 Branched-chain amino acid transport ATP-binding protein LivF [Variovorax sp. WDL1]PNG58530.1 High-affinity branched-chain amino acid transport ATP-binding protein LivF [Variovorax sp. B4]PNG61680.1 High-affinity branched-chain amino acid transport ATP-binding protein LivF [Variovorax sp. B2]VTV12273.1 LIV-I protein F [Variovorax sp. WDL1]
MLEVHDLQVAYGAANALWGVSLELRRGELLCVVGPNGAGKTTLIATLAGMLRARSGRIVFDGQDITRLPAHRFCEAGIALVPEGRRLFTGMTVRENLELGSLLPQAKAQRQQTMAQVLDLFPALNEKLASPAGELSGGQQQMVAIARALMARPRLLLLDEPSLGLSPRIVGDMFAAIRRINADGVSVLLVEQNVAMAMEVSQRAYVLEEGRMVAEGLPQELLARPEIQRVYLGV